MSAAFGALVIALLLWEVALRVELLDMAVIWAFRKAGIEL